MKVKITVVAGREERLGRTEEEKQRTGGEEIKQQHVKSKRGRRMVEMKIGTGDSKEQQ